MKQMVQACRRMSDLPKKNEGALADIGLTSLMRSAAILALKFFLMMVLAITFPVQSAIALEIKTPVGSCVGCGAKITIGEPCRSGCPYAPKTTAPGVGNPVNTAAGLRNDLVSGFASQFLGQMLAGDPQRAARAQARAQARALELERERAVRETEAAQKRQETFARLRDSLKLDGFDGDNGGLLLKGVDVGQDEGLVLKDGDSSGELAPKLDDADLKPLGTRAAANVADGDAINTDTKVVDLRNYQRAGYIATLPNASDDAIIAAAQGDVSIIDLPAPNLIPVVSDAGLLEFQKANITYRESHASSAKASESFNRAQAQREVAALELREMKADLERQLAKESDTAELARKHELMGKIFATARAEHEAWVTAKAEQDATQAREAFERATLLGVIRSLRGGKAASAPSAVQASGSSNPQSDAAEEARTISAMNDFARTLEWDTEERDRLNTALKALAFDGNRASSNIDIRLAWSGIALDDENAKLAKEASGGAGPDMPGAGTQGYNDCAVFALANATGLPYGLVAARATMFLNEGAWRTPDERANAQRAIESRGLNGGEVILLAESFGQVEVVSSGEFPRLLREGHPIMLNVVPPNGDVRDGHEIVLTRTFQHGDQTWYELMDSNTGPTRRRYVSAEKLAVIQKEKGVVFRPDKNRTLLPLRPADESQAIGAPLNQEEK